MKIHTHQFYSHKVWLENSNETRIFVLELCNSFEFLTTNANYSMYILKTFVKVLMQYLLCKWPYFIKPYVLENQRFFGLGTIYDFFVYEIATVYGLFVWHNVNISLVKNLKFLRITCLYGSRSYYNIEIEWHVSNNSINILYSFKLERIRYN